MPNAKQLLYQTGKSSHRRFSIKTLSLKISDLCEIIKNTYFEEHLRTAMNYEMNWLYEVINWNFVSRLHLKPSWLNNITKIPVAFKQKL